MPPAAGAGWPEKRSLSGSSDGGIEPAAMCLDAACGDMVGFGANKQMGVCSKTPRGAGLFSGSCAMLKAAGAFS